MADSDEGSQAYSGAPSGDDEDYSDVPTEYDSDDGSTSGESDGDDVGDAPPRPTLRPHPRDSEPHTGRRKKYDRQTEANRATLQELADELRLDYDDQLKMRESETVTIRTILEDANARNCLPPPAEELIATLESDDKTRDMLLALHVDPLHFDPDAWPTVLEKCPDPFADNIPARANGRQGARPRLEADVARAQLDAYDSEFPADSHRSVPRRVEMDRHPESETHADIYIGATIGDKPEGRLKHDMPAASDDSADARKKKATNVNVRKINYQTITGREGWQAYEIVTLRQHLEGGDDPTLNPSQLWSQNKRFCNLESSLIDIGGRSSWNSARGGIAEGEYLPEVDLEELIHLVDAHYMLRDVPSVPTQPTTTQRAWVGTHYKNMAQSFGTLEGSRAIHERALLSAASYASAFHASARGYIPAITIMKDITRRAYTGRETLHGPISGSGPRIHYSLFNTAFRYSDEADRLSDDVNHNSKFYLPVHDFWAVSTKLAAPMGVYRAGAFLSSYLHKLKPLLVCTQSAQVMKALEKDVGLLPDCEATSRFLADEDLFSLDSVLEGIVDSQGEMKWKSLAEFRFTPHVGNVCIGRYGSSDNPQYYIQVLERDPGSTKYDPQLELLIYRLTILAKLKIRIALSLLPDDIDTVDRSDLAWFEAKVVEINTACTHLKTEDGLSLEQHLHVCRDKLVRISNALGSGRMRGKSVYTPVQRTAANDEMKFQGRGRTSGQECPIRLAQLDRLLLRHADQMALSTTRALLVSPRGKPVGSPSYRQWFLEYPIAGRSINRVASGTLNEPKKHLVTKADIAAYSNGRKGVGGSNSIKLVKGYDEKGFKTSKTATSALEHLAVSNSNCSRFNAGHQSAGLYRFECAHCGSVRAGTKNTTHKCLDTGEIVKASGLPYKELGFPQQIVWDPVLGGELAPGLSDKLITRPAHDFLSPADYAAVGLENGCEVGLVYYPRTDAQVPQRWCYVQAILCLAMAAGKGKGTAGPGNSGAGDDVRIAGLRMGWNDVIKILTGQEEWSIWCMRCATSTTCPWRGLWITKSEDDNKSPQHRAPAKWVEAARAPQAEESEGASTDVDSDARPAKRRKASVKIQATASSSRAQPPVVRTATTRSTPHEKPYKQRWHASKWVGEITQFTQLREGEILRMLHACYFKKDPYNEMLDGKEGVLIRYSTEAAEW